jgi:hypothetical protein
MNKHSQNMDTLTIDLKLREYLNCYTAIGWVDHELLRQAFNKFQIAQAVAEGHLIPVAPGEELEDVDCGIFVVGGNRLFYRVVPFEYV